MAFPDGWNYYKEYEQPGTADGEQTNYQVTITVTHVTDKMRSDFEDVRFTLEDNTELDYHLVSYTASTSAVFIVKIPTIPTGGVTLRMWYGNSDATTTSDPESVYLFYDSCTGTFTDKWTVIASGGGETEGYATVGDKQAVKISNVNVFAKIRNNTSISFPFKLEFDAYKAGDIWLVIYSQPSSPAETDRYRARFDKRSSDTFAERIDKNGTQIGSANNLTGLSNNIWYPIILTVDQNNVHTFKINGSVAASATDNTYPSGYIGFMTSATSGYHGFTNIRISKYTSNPPNSGSFGSEVTIIPIGNAVATGLPIVMYNVPTGEAVATGLPVYFANWEFIAIGNATASGLPLEKWYAYTPSFFILDENGFIVKDLSFESLHPGKKSVVKKLTAVNNLESEMVMTLTPGESLNQIGDSLDTYLSQYHSIDDMNYSNSALTLAIPALGELDFYTYWQPPSTGKIGWKQWLYDLDLEGVPSLEGWGYVSWFTVTGTGDAITIPYTPEEPVRIDYVHGLMRYDFRDIRFALEDHTILKHSIITKTDNDHAYFFVQLPEIPAGDMVIYVYSGNKDAEDVSDPTIIPILDHFRGTTLKSYNWKVRTLSYSVDNGLLIRYSHFGVTGDVQYKLQVPSNFDIETSISQVNRKDNRTALSLFKNDNTPIVKIGIWTNTSTTGRHYAETESVWFNIAPTWTDAGNGIIYGPQIAWLNGSAYRMVRDGSMISVYVNDVHIADTIITSEVNSLGIFSDAPSLGYSATIDYIGETELVPITPPTTGEVEPVWINIYPIPVKGDILYQSCELPGITPERRFAVKLGDTLYE